LLYLADSSSQTLDIRLNQVNLQVEELNRWLYGVSNKAATLSLGLQKILPEYAQKAKSLSESIDSLIGVITPWLILVKIN